MKKPRTCNACRAYPLLFSTKCQLGYPVETKYNKFLRAYFNPRPTVQCPKPLTIIALIDAPKYVKEN